MEVLEELRILSEEFVKREYKLYIVGGYVRNHLLGLSSDDIDITSSLPTDELIKICRKLKIKTTNINPKLGTIQLTFNKCKFEYTQFRKESYNTTGIHTPSEVEFVEDIDTDCQRRDFSINSIYYDISSNEFVDMCNGKDDISNKLIRTVRNPIITLSDDGLRILRCIRFSSQLDFDIEKKTSKALKTYTPLLKQISKERILKEIQQIVVADYKYSKNNSRFLKLCNQLKLPQYLFNSSLTRMKKIPKADIFNFYQLGKDSRLIGFYILILKNYFLGYIDNLQLEYNINMLLGTNGIKESNNNIDTTEKLYRVFQNITYNKDILNASINYLTLSDSERQIIDVFLNSKSKNALSDKISYVKNNNLPTSIHQLDITAQDLLDAGITRMYISKILSTLYNQVLNMCVENTNSALKELALQIHETFLNIKEQI